MSNYADLLDSIETTYEHVQDFEHASGKSVSTHAAKKKDVALLILVVLKPKKYATPLIPDFLRW